MVNAIQPKMMQESRAAPILLFLGLLVGVQIAGLWGALFGVPILAVIVILVNHWLDIYSPEDAALADLAEAEHRHEAANEARRRAGRRPSGRGTEALRRSRELPGGADPPPAPSATAVGSEIPNTRATVRRTRAHRPPAHRPPPGPR